MTNPSLVKASPLASVAAELRSGERDLIEYIDEALRRVETVEPQIEALLAEPGRRARLMMEATVLQERYPNPSERPPLYGVLIGVKDIFHADGFVTQGGSAVPPDMFAGIEAESVTRLKQAGAIVLGKTVTTEFAYFEPGPTRNPHNLGHTPGGSSSGSAAAVAAGLCALALGSQTVGSVIRPAAFCGIVGFKPSAGRISTAGVIPLAPTWDHVGLFTQDVAGAALAASILCDGWNQDSSDTQPVLGVPAGPYLAQSDEEGFFGFESALALLGEAGYGIQHVAAFDDIEEINTLHRKLMAAEAAKVHAKAFQQHEDLYRPRTAGLIREGQSVSAGDVRKARAGRESLRQRLETLMVQNGIDIWVSPAATGTAPEGIDTTGDPTMNLPWTHSGMPAVTVPAGHGSDGLPLGLQCVAALNADERLLGWVGRIAEVMAQPR